MTLIPQLHKIDLKPRKIVRFKEGQKLQIQDVAPIPFDAETADEIRSAAIQAAIGVPWVEKLESVMTDNQLAYVMAVWDTIPDGRSNFMSAFFSILNENL